MLDLVLVGLNHRTADLAMRERMAYPAGAIPDTLRMMVRQPGIREAMIVSTCNRVEMLAGVDSCCAGADLIESFLCESRGVSSDELRDKLYRFSEQEAIQHIFRLASSLDSMILGEPQILGQMKTFYGIAVDTGTAGAYLNLLMQAAFHTAKRVRAETSIGEYSVSVSSAAVELARKVFGDLDGRSILIIGAGKMGDLTLRHLSTARLKIIRVANRSPEAAAELAARFSGEAVPLGDIAQWLGLSDIVITSTGSPDILVTKQMAQSTIAQRRNSPVIFIDISVPRNVDPAVSEVDNVFCYDIDDLGAVVDANLEERRREAVYAEKLVLQEVEAFRSRIETQDMSPVVAQLQSKIQEICRLELQRFLKRSGPRNEKEIQELEWMVNRIARKISHPLVIQLKSGKQDSEHPETYLDAIKRIFKLQKSAES